MTLARLSRATSYHLLAAHSFTMYRIRSLEHKPLIIADAVIAEYGENKVETLHVKVWEILLHPSERANLHLANRTCSRSERIVTSPPSCSRWALSAFAHALSCSFLSTHSDSPSTR